MAIQQIAYDIPNDIALGIAKGLYKRFGGVVRDAKTGVIVKHLKEVSVPEETAKKGILQTAKSHPAVAIGTGVFIAVGTAGVAYFIRKKDTHKLKKNSPKAVIDFDKSLKEYLEAVRKGKLEENNIDRLLQSIEQLKELGNEEHVTLDLSSEEFKQLVDMIYDYTKKLAKINSVKLEKIKSESHSSIVDLESYLRIQKDIFNEVA